MSVHVRVFFFNGTAPTEIYTLSLHDALPILVRSESTEMSMSEGIQRLMSGMISRMRSTVSDRKSTRLNSSHVKISYAVFCLKKKKNRRVSFAVSKAAVRV